MTADPTTHSRAIAYVLRHRPETVAGDGWATIDATCAALRALGHAIDADAVRAIALADAVRYELDGERVRARHGHSVPVVIDHPVATPPEQLFHGTVARALPSIRLHGLVRGERLAVHLSSRPEDALRVGGRRGAPIGIVVRARAAHDDGIVFRKVDGGTVWLVETVPPRYLAIPDINPEARGAPRSSRGRG